MDEFLADESVDFRIVESLREDGYEIKAIIEMNPGIDDEEVLGLANEIEAVLLTEDKDFGELVFRLDYPNCGIILMRLAGVEIEDRIKIVRSVFNDHLAEFKNSFTIIAENKLRIRKQED